MHITSHMLIHVHGCICLLLLECQTTGRTPESQAESIRLIVMQHYTRQLLLHCTFIVSILHMHRETNWMLCWGLADLISLSSSARLVYCCWSLFLDTSTHEFSVGFVVLTTAHLQNMGNGFMTRNVTGFYFKKRKKKEQVRNDFLTLGGMTVSLKNRRSIVLLRASRKKCVFLAKLICR